VIFYNELKLVDFVPCMVETPVQPRQFWEKKLKPVDFVLHTVVDSNAEMVIVGKKLKTVDSRVQSLYISRSFAL